MSFETPYAKVGNAITLAIHGTRNLVEKGEGGKALKSDLIAQYTSPVGEG
jgi:hypothetical protein